VIAMPPNFGTSTTPDTTGAIYPNQPVPGVKAERKNRPKAKAKAKPSVKARKSRKGK
jgi:hypothetical protein